ncbi:TetR/AcrR family transcriptional regulator [Streptomyces sp. NPDC059866]|uniref:TetR/AcrR family transcriptional regulator n=1 Tax=Streptomyces sp. NPDC059866 TaxID=3346978 RepID=UPI003657C068
MEIARAAAGLFVRRGLRATRAEDIAQAAGIAPRTFYRYFATKEEAVAPLYAAGAQRWAEAVREAPAGLSVPEALEHAIRHTLTPGLGVSAASWEWVRTLIHLANTSPAIGKVWAEVCRASEDMLAEVLAERARAGTSSVTERQDNVADRITVTPELRFTAAVASAAVRVAVESWASGPAPASGPNGPAPASGPNGPAPASGPNGPAELALRNLGALRGFRWEGEAEAGGH